MARKNSKITIHMVSSLDGFIAKKNGDISWMQSKDSYGKGVELTEEYIADFLQSIDCYVMGSRTYEHALELGWPYGDKKVFVFTKRELSTDRESVEFLSGDLDKLVRERIRPYFRNVWMVGGAMLTKEFLRLDLADEINITIIPIILGDGQLFFDYVERERLLHLKDVTAFSDGMVEMCYEIRKQ